MPRPDETQYRLIAWTGDSGAAERLAVQVLLASGFEDPDPSHPYGGPDGGRDAIFTQGGERWVMAVYFPQSDHSFTDVKNKFASDIEAAKKHRPKGVAFVTNQEITIGERDKLRELVSDIKIEVFHMERIAALLDQPSMVGIRQKFLGIDPGTVPLDLQLTVGGAGHFVLGGNELREALLAAADESDREAATSRRAMSPSQRQHLAVLAGILHEDPPPPPPTDGEVEKAITERRDRVEKAWDPIEDYVIGLTCPAIHFTIMNSAESFLHDVRVVITFAGAHGVEKRQVEDFEHEKLLDPDYERPVSIYGPSALTDFKPVGYPVEWKNKDTGLEVRITLAELPPGEAFEWSSDNYEDVVLVASSDESIHVTWLAIAQQYGASFIGPALDVPVGEILSIDLAARLFAEYGDE